jgi:hypothetical protein
VMKESTSRRINFSYKPFMASPNPFMLATP